MRKKVEVVIDDQAKSSVKLMYISFKGKPFLESHHIAMVNHLHKAGDVEVKVHQVFRNRRSMQETDLQVTGSVIEVSIDGINFSKIHSRIEKAVRKAMRGKK